MLPPSIGCDMKTSWKDFIKAFIVIALLIAGLGLASSEAPPTFVDINHGQTVLDIR